MKGRMKLEKLLEDSQFAVGVSRKRIQIASYGAILGGFLFLINLLMQNYLDMDMGDDYILHDPSHPAFYLNILTLFVAMVGFLLALFTLNKHVKAKGSGVMWQLGFFLSAFTQFIFSLTLIQGIAQVVGLNTLSDSLITVIGIGSLGIYIGGVPIGIFMLRRKIIPKASAILFLLTIPAVISYFFFYSMGLPILGGLLMGVTYGGAWVLIGLYFRRFLKE